jgi:hypothetical protein
MAVTQAETTKNNEDAPVFVRPVAPSIDEIDHHEIDFDSNNIIQITK